MIQIVARYRDGRMAKGTTLNFSPNGNHFHVQSLGDPYGEGIRVEFDELKAIFFVRDLAGNPHHRTRDLPMRARYSRHVRLRFQDGEEIVGLSNPDEHEPGIFIYPSDPLSNNERVFAIRGYVAILEDVDDVALAEAVAVEEAEGTSFDPGPEAEADAEQVQRGVEEA